MSDKSMDNKLPEAVFGKGVNGKHISSGFEKEVDGKPIGEDHFSKTPRKNIFFVIKAVGKRKTRFPIFSNNLFSKQAYACVMV